MRNPATLLLFPTLLAACGAPQAPVLELRGETMGTSYAVEIVDPPPALTRDVLDAATAESLARVDSRMSTWRDDSELMRFNRSRSTQWFPISEDTAIVVAEALHVSELSEGAFDPTVRPLVELWGFAGVPAATLPPAPEGLARARARVGFRDLRARQTPPALRKARADLELDLSGIAKGYAVDLVAEQLARAGATDFLVEIGGELRGSGLNRRGEAWRIAVEQPTLERGRVQSLVALRGEAIATSGSYRNFAARGVQRFAHVLDPHTGAPVGDALVSVSVLAPSAMRADALATALFALGPERGLALAEREDLAVLFLIAGRSGLVERSNAAFDARRIPAASVSR
jgi:thiamine biosynthesis lipoprotein